MATEPYRDGAVLWPSVPTESQRHYSPESPDEVSCPCDETCRGGPLDDVIVHRVDTASAVPMQLARAIDQRCLFPFAMISGCAVSAM